MPSTPTEAVLDVNVKISLRSMQGHRQWTDGYLLHLARRHGLALASLESRMANLDDAAQPVLFVVS